MTPARHLIVSADAAPRLRGRHHALVLPGVSQDGPAHLRGSVRELLIAAERDGLHTVVLAPEISDLDAAPALLCRRVVTDRADVESAAAARYGPERVLRVRSARTADVPEWIGDLPRPEARTMRRRIRRAARRFGPARALHAMIAGRPMIAGRRRHERRTR